MAKKQQQQQKPKKTQKRMKSVGNKYDPQR